MQDRLPALRLRPRLLRPLAREADAVGYPRRRLPRVTSVEHLLARSVSPHSLTLPEAFQGLPGMAHGGSVLAAFDAMAGRRGAGAPREVSATYRRKVPLNTPLPLEVRNSGSESEFRLSDGRHLLVEGRVRAASGPSERADLPGDLGGGSPLPISNRCFACGIQNSLGLQVALRFDERRVWTEYLPREPFRTADGHLATAALTTLLDETAFWLGALASGESGMTTELRVTLHRVAVKFGEPLIVVGQRARTAQRSDDPRYWETEAMVLSPAGVALASGRITFVAVRGAAKRLVTGMLSMNPPDVVRRVFPT